MGDGGWIDFDDRPMLEYERMLRKGAPKAMAFASKATVNTAAFQTRAHSMRAIRKTMTLRNKWVERSVKVVPARTLNIKRQAAEVGSALKLLEVQEFGGNKRQPTLATRSASREGRGDTARRRLPPRGFQARNIKLPKQLRTRRNRTPRQRNQAIIAMARKRRQRLVFLDFGPKGRGIFDVRGKRLEAIAIFWPKVVKIPANPWLLPATLKVAATMPRLYKHALTKQLSRHRLWKGGAF